MSKLFLSIFVVSILSACDLQPKIASIPDSVGNFISERYPALLADPDTQPEIYNSAATDYGVYASPELYGNEFSDDYVLYASVNDYIIPPQATDAQQNQQPDDNVQNVVTVDAGTTKDAEPVAMVAETDVDETDESVTDAVSDEYLQVPMYGTLDLSDINQNPNTVVVAKGDTLYSIARQYNMTVQELALINGLSEPYKITIGQRLKLVDNSPPAVTVTVKAAAPDVPVATPEKVVVPPPVRQAPKQETVATIPVVKSEPVPVQTAQVVIDKPIKTTTRVELQEITVAAGDTLYSISRRYSIPVNDLAVINELEAPFTVRAGQKLKVPNLSAPDVRVATSVTQSQVKKATGKKSDAIVVKTVTPVNATKANVKTNARAADTKTTKGQGGQKTTAANKKQTDKSNTAGNKKQQKPESKKQPENVKTQNKTKTKTEKTADKKSGVKKTETKQKISSDPSKSLPKIAARSSSKFSWPVRGKILSHFGAKSQGLFNDGINISATRGTAVRSAENGVVAYAGNEVKGMGNLVIIQHADGWMTVYAHMDSMIVRRGAKVNVGQKIGTVGATGRVDKPQLHFEIRKGKKAYDPEKQLKK